MTDVEARLKDYADAALAGVEPVTAEEARTARPNRTSHPTNSRGLRTLAVATIVLVVIGVGAAVMVSDGEDPADRIAAGPSDYPLTLDGHLDWAVTALNGAAVTTEAELRERYADDFLAAIPPEKLRSQLESPRALAPWRVLSEVERRGEDVLATQIISEGGEQARLTFHRASDGRIDAMTILYATPCASPAAADSALDPPLRAALDWVNELNASTRVPSDDELRQRFAPSFLDAVPVDRFRALLPQLRGLGPYTLRSFEGSPTKTGLTARVGLRTGEEGRLSLVIEARPPHRIMGFTVVTQPPCQAVVPG